MTFLKDGMMTIHKALAYARSDLVQLFLAVEPSLAQMSYRDNPATHLALVLGGFESFRDQCAASLTALLNSGANLEAVDRLGRSVMHWTGFYNMAEMTRELLERGANGKRKDYAGMTPADVCVERDNVETLVVLVNSSSNK